MLIAVSPGALLMNNLIVLVLGRPLATHLAVPGYGDLLAQGCATGVGLGWNSLSDTWRHAE